MKPMFLRVYLLLQFCPEFNCASELGVNERNTLSPPFILEKHSFWGNDFDNGGGMSRSIQSFALKRHEDSAGKFQFSIFILNFFSTDPRGENVNPFLT